MLITFPGKRVLVTGAARGIGHGIVRAFADEGADVVCVSRTRENSQKVADEIKAKGGEAVANYDSVENGESIIKTAIDAFGRVDVLVNNAGILRDKSFVKMTEHDWDLIMKVHVKGSFACAKAAWPHFRK